MAAAHFWKKTYQIWDFSLDIDVWIKLYFKEEPLTNQFEVSFGKHISDLFW